MDDAEILLSCLYTNPPAGATRKKVESAYADWKVARERGERISFGDMLVRKGVLGKGEPEKLLAAEKAAYGKSKVGEKKVGAPSSKKGVAAAVPAAATKPAKTDWTKQAVPAILVGILGALLVWRMIPKPQLGLDDLANKQDPSRVRKKDWLEPPKEGPRISPSLATGTDPVLDTINEVITEATSGDVEKAEEKLEKAIREAKTDEEKQRLEEVRWRLKVIRKQRKAAREALDEARRLAREGKIEEAAEKLAGVDVPEESPEKRAVEEAKRGGGIGKDLKPQSSKDPDKPKAPRPPRDKRTPPKVPRKEKPVPTKPTGADEGPVSAPPPPPSSDDEGGKLPTDELKLEKKTQGKRKHGQRPRGESRDGALVTSFIDEVDEDPEDDDADDPATFKGGVPPVALATPKEIEPERAEALGKLATEGAAYLAKVKEWMTEQRTYRDGAPAREAERVKGATSELPNGRFLKRIEIPGGLVLNDAIVSKYDGNGFALKDPAKKAEWGSSWTQSPDLGFEVRRLAADPNEARDFMRLGRWCARYRFFTQAKSAFRKALSLDGSLSNRVPDLDVLEKESKLFNGKLVRSGENVRVTWNFDSATDVADFDPQGSIWTANGKLNLECRDRTVALCMGLKSIVFKDSLALDVRFDPNSAFVTFGFMMRSTDEENGGRPHTYQVQYDIEGGRALLADAGVPSPLAVGEAGRRITTARLEVVKDSLWVRVGNFRAKVPLVVPPHWEVLPFVGSLGGTVVMDQVQLSGHAHPDWLRTKLGGADFKMLLRLEDAIGAPPFAYQHREPQLSAEVAYLSTEVTPKVLEVYEKAKRNLEKETVSGTIAALGQLKYVTDEAPGFAPAQYQLAKALLVFKRRALALECLNEAVTSAGGFAEALALRAEVLAQLRRFPEAAADLKKAMEWRPDIAEVRAHAGKLALAEQRLVDARDELELSYALDPRVSATEWMTAFVGHAVDGPPWEKATRIETEHYTWVSSVKKERVAQIADLLEQVRPIYESALGIKAPKEKRKSAVILFDSMASFQDYNQIAIQSGLPDAAIGVFFPATKELQVCDNLDDSSAMKTCATAFHEGFHQWFDRMAETDTIPPWCNEGLGEYFAGAKVETGLVRVGQIHKGRLLNLFQYGPIPIDDLMNDDHPNFMAHGFQRYAQSWAVVHYLMEGDGEKWKMLLIAYLEHLRAGRSPVNAYNRTFGRIDMDDLETGWRKHVMKLVQRAQNN